MNSKTLVLNGSPNKKGYSMTLMHALFSLDNYDLMHAYDLTLTSCDDCKVCHHQPTCKYNHDDLPKVLEALKSCETLIIVTPVYFGAMSDQLLRILNRFQQLFEQKYTHKHSLPPIKNLYVVATAGAKNEAMFDGVKLTTTILESLFSVQNAKVFTFNNTDGIKDPLHYYHDLLHTYKKHLN